MKKFMTALAATLILLVMAAAIGGVTPNYMISSPAMLTGMGAKLACSGRYVSGLSKEQAFVDLQSYSPVLKLVDLSFDDQNKSVAAGLLGMKTTQARYREGLGCSLSIGDTKALDNVKTQSISLSADNWPVGEGNGDVQAPWQQKLDDLLAADNQAGLNTRALLILKDGKLVAESYAQGFDESSKLLGWSMAKSVTALMIGHMEMKGALSNSKLPIFSQWSEDQRQDIRLDDLLHMSSGLDFSETYDPGAGATDMLFTRHSAAELPLAAASIHPPGKQFEYSSGTTNLLSKLIYDYSGGTAQTNADFLQRTLIEPLRLKDFVFEPDPSGMSVGSSYLYASAREWAKFGQIMLNGGELNGYRLVTDDWVERAQKPNSSANEKAYGYQFWLNSGNETLRWPDLPQDSYGALGNRKQIVMIVPSEQVVIVRLGWTSGSYPTNDNLSKILAFLRSETNPA